MNARGRTTTKEIVQEDSRQPMSRKPRGENAGGFGVVGRVRDAKRGQRRSWVGERGSACARDYRVSQNGGSTRQGWCACASSSCRCAGRCRSGELGMLEMLAGGEVRLAIVATSRAKSEKRSGGHGRESGRILRGDLQQGRRVAQQVRHSWMRNQGMVARRRGSKVRWKTE
jgi:hypothetical protein